MESYGHILPMAHVVFSALPEDPAGEKAVCSHRPVCLRRMNGNVIQETPGSSRPNSKTNKN